MAYMNSQTVMSSEEYTIRDNIIYNSRNSAYGLCGINNGILIPAGWQDNTGTALGESQRNDRYQKITLTPRFKIGG